MKNLLSLLIFISLISCKQSNNSEASYNTNEIIFVVEMNSNEGKSIEEIAEFSKFYTDIINANEPNSMGWGFYEYRDKIILIERYFDDNAMMQHAKNISEGGPRDTICEIYGTFYD